MLPSKVLIVDASALCYAAFYGVGGLGTAQGPTGVIYGFFNQLQTICRMQQVAHIVFCWDSKQSHRRRIFPGYKDRSKKKKDPKLVEAYGQFVQLRDEIIPRLGFVNSFHATGFEADDLIASVCRMCAPASGQHYIIASTDHDLYQLLQPDVSMYLFNKRQMYTERDFVREYSMHPLFWADVKAIAGCTSDTVPGIPGIGEKTAVKYISQEVPHPKIDCIEGKRIIQRNKKLVTLPYPGTPNFSLDWDTLPSYAAWLDLCDELEFYSFARTPKVWEQIFTLTAPNDNPVKIVIGRRRHA